MGRFGFNDFEDLQAIKRLHGLVGWTLLSPLKTAGVAQLVEHHLAKVDVASSSLVTRSSLRLERSANRRLERARRSLGEGGPPKRTSFGWQASPLIFYPFSVYLWRRTAEPDWVKAHEELLQAHASGQLVIIRRPGRKRLELEITCRSRPNSIMLINKFGGRIEPLPRNWLKQFTCAVSKSIRIGKRLIISSVGRSLGPRLARHETRSTLIIPA